MAREIVDGIDNANRQESQNFMIPWIKFVDIGHTAVMIPMAGAIAAWLIAGRAWKMALCWCVIFTAALSVVALSKIAFLGWGIGIPSLDFKALSGHAMLTTAVIPVMFYLLLQWSPPIVRAAGVLLGIVFGVIMVFCLVAFNFHTVSEAIAGCILGAFVTFGFVWTSGTLPIPRLNRWLIPFSASAFLAVWYVKPASIEHSIIVVALYFSGHDAPYSWATYNLNP